MDKNNISHDELKKKNNFKRGVLIWIIIFAIALVKKTLQNDTFYTIKIGELILNNGIDMLDHFSYHTNLSYTYPHWLYDVFIYLIYKIGNYFGIYISSLILFILLILIVFKINNKVSKSISIAAFATFICTLAISSFVTARAQLASFILFALEIYCIESFLKKPKIKYAIFLLLISLILCNIHVAVWPFYFILYLPYLAEYLISKICSKIKIKSQNKFLLSIKNKFILEKNENIKKLFLIMLVSILTGLITPIKDTPYTYLIKTMMGNSQSYIQEHQKISWRESPFTIIIACETILLAILSKIKLRDLFMIFGLVLMSIVSIRHMSLLALIGTICFCRIFSIFLETYNFNVDKYIISFFSKKYIVIISFLIVITFSSLLINYQFKKPYINSKLYPTEAVKYLNEFVDIDDMRIYNDYDFGSYLILNDIKVFIDSRADLYTKQFSKFTYDIFDDYEFITNNYQEKFEFYGITHVLIYKNSNLDNILRYDLNYQNIYKDDHFVIYKKLKTPNVIVKKIETSE